MTFNNNFQKRTLRSQKTINCNARSNMETLCFISFSIKNSFKILTGHFLICQDIFTEKIHFYGRVYCRNPLFTATLLPWFATEIEVHTNYETISYSTSELVGTFNNQVVDEGVWVRKCLCLVYLKVPTKPLVI